MTPLISSSPISCVELWKDRAHQPGQGIRDLMQGEGTDKWLLDLQCEVNGEPRTALPTMLLLNKRTPPQEPAPH